MKGLFTVFMLSILTLTAHGQNDSAVFISVDTLSQGTEDTTFASADTTNFCGCKGVKEVQACKGCFVESEGVLKIGYNMSFVEKKIMNGSCWSFLNEIYKRAGNKKRAVFASSKSGPYADCSLLRPGDWIYHVNYGYHGVEHSAMFICWKDRKKKIAVTMSYVGQKRARPGRLDEADLKGVYAIYRLVE